MLRGVEKMNDKKQDITSSQLAALTISAQIGIGSLFLPSILAQKVGHDGWISTILAGFVCTIITILIMLLLKRYSNKTIFDINFLLYGKFFGYFLNAVFTLYLLFIGGITIRVFEEIVNIIILKFTPPIVITILILMPAIYAASKGLKVICKFSVLIYIAYFFLILCCLLNLKNVRFTYLMPIGKAGLAPIVNNMQLAIYSYLGFELVTLIYPNIKNKEKALKHMVIGMGFTTVFYTFLAAFMTILFGETKLSMLVLPIYSMGQIISVPVIERLDTLFLLMWFPTMDSTVRAYFFSSYHSILMLFNVKNKKILLLIVSIIEILISRIPQNFESVNRYSGYSAIFGEVVICFIIITFFLSLFRKKGA